MPERNGNRFHFTSATVRDGCLPPNGELNGKGRPVVQKLYWDTELAGFGVVVVRPHRRNGKVRVTKSFVVQHSVGGRPKRVTIGRFGAWNVTDARRRARELIVQMDSGVDPTRQWREEWARGVTLAEALEMHVAALEAKGRTERYRRDGRRGIMRHFPDRLERPLAKITPDDCAVRQRRITERNGPSDG